MPAQRDRIAGGRSAYDDRRLASRSLLACRESISSRVSAHEPDWFAFLALVFGRLTTYAIVIAGFAGVARADNLAAIAEHLSQIDSADAPPELRDLARDLRRSPGAANEVLTALSPEGYDAQTTALYEVGRLMTDLHLERPRECEEGVLEPWIGRPDPLPCHSPTWAPWIAGIGTLRSRDGFGGHPEYDTLIGGAAVGVDRRLVRGLDMSLAFATLNGSVDVDSAGSSDLTILDLSGHLSWTYRVVRAQAAVSWGHGFHSDRRPIRISISGGDTSVDLRGADDHESDRVSLAGEIGANVSLGPFSLEPIVGIDWAWIDQESISEKGTGPFGIKVRSRDDEVGSIAVGARLGSVYQIALRSGRRAEWLDGILRPHADVRWRKLLTGAERDIDARLIGAPTGIRDFRIEGEEDSEGYQIAAGISFVPANANRLQLDLRYEAFVASHTLQQNLTFRVDIGF